MDKEIQVECSTFETARGEVDWINRRFGVQTFVTRRSDGKGILRVAGSEGQIIDLTRIFRAKGFLVSYSD